MLKITAEIDGMACEMCESHIKDAIRRSFNVKKTDASHRKGTLTIISPAPIDDSELKDVIEKLGYTVSAVHTEPYNKKTFSLFGR